MTFYNIPRKWEYIAKRFDEINVPKFAKLARDLDAECVKAYGDEHTEYWVDAYTRKIIDRMSIAELVNNAQMCTCCEKSGFVGNTRSRNCAQCVLSEKGRELWTFMFDEWE